MNDLISRQAAIDALEEYADRLQMVNWKENPNVPYKVHSLNWCINTIRDLPSAQERKKGKWIKVHGFCTPGGDPGWACSECGKGVHVYGIEHGTYGADVSEGQWKACPNCGTEMRGED